MQERNAFARFSFLPNAFKKTFEIMKTIPFTATATVFAAMLLLNTPCSQAQNPTPAPTATPVAAETPAASPASGNGGDRAEQFRQKMNEFLKTALKASDDEWAIIQPLLEKVQAKQRETIMSRFNFPGGRRGGDRPGRPERPAAPEVDALKAALEAEGTSPADIKTRLEAVRAARKKALTELDQAREDLRKVLTQRQEATLVMVGILE